MAQPTGTFSSYDAVGNREDLIDNIFDVSPVETPVLSAIKKGEATATTHEWQTDVLEAAGSNAHIEGDDASPTTTQPTTRLNNQTQIFKKHVVVSNTQEKVKKAGRKSEVAYQTARRMQAIKKDFEWSILDGGGAGGIGNAKVVGNDTTARELGSLQTYLTTNTSGGSGGADPTGDGTDVRTAGTLRAVTEPILESVLQSMFNNSTSDYLMCTVGAFNKGAISDFTTAATRYVTTDDKKLTASIDVYDGDFHTLKIVPCRQQSANNAYLINSQYLSWAELRPMIRYELAKTGDSQRYEIVAESTLEVCNEAALGLIADLTIT